MGRGGGDVMLSSGGGGQLGALLWVSGQLSLMLEVHCCVVSGQLSSGSPGGLLCGEWAVVFGESRGESRGIAVW